MKAEFDDYIDNYRANLDRACALSGETSSFFAQYKAAKLREWLPNRIGKKQHILDFGCGDGLMTSYVASYFSDAILYGVDPSVESIKRAQQQFPSIQFSSNYDEKPDLEFSDNCFDLIFAAGAFHHIPFARHEGYLQEIFRILKTGGTFVMFELNPLNPLTVWTFKHNPIDYNARMLKPWYGSMLCKHHGNPRTAAIKFYCFFPHWLYFLRPVERYLTYLPLGALYAVIIEK